MKKSISAVKRLGHWIYEMTAVSNYRTIERRINDIKDEAIWMSSSI